MTSPASLFKVEPTCSMSELNEWMGDFTSALHTGALIPLTDPEKIEEYVENIERAHAWVLTVPEATQKNHAGILMIRILDASLKVLPDATEWLSGLKIDIAQRIFGAPLEEPFGAPFGGPR